KPGKTSATRCSATEPRSNPSPDQPQLLGVTERHPHEVGQDQSSHIALVLLLSRSREGTRAMFWYSWHMGVTNQTLEHLRLLRSGGVLQRYQDQTLIRQADLQIPLREDEFKRLYTPGLIERTSFDTLEEYQLTSDG